MALTYDQRLKVADIAKELTLQFGAQLTYTDTSNGTSMNKELTEQVNELYSQFFTNVERLIENK